MFFFLFCRICLFLQFTVSAAVNILLWYCIQMNNRTSFQTCFSPASCPSPSADHPKRLWLSVTKHNHNRAIELLPEWLQAKSGMSPPCETCIVGTEQMLELQTHTGPAAPSCGCVGSDRHAWTNLNTDTWLQDNIRSYNRKWLGFHAILWRKKMKKFDSCTKRHHQEKL